MADSETFRRRQDAIDKGKDYESYVVADYVLKLITDNAVRNFKLTSNDANFGKFDDVVVKIEKEECTERYALQLKHVGNTKKLNLRQLREENGDFSIKKYFSSFQELNNSFSDYKLILSTNRAFSLNDDRNVDFQFNVEKDVFHIRIVKCKAVTLLNTSRKSDECFQFRIVGNENPLSTERQEYEQFFDRFFLYANQANVETLKRDIPKQIKKQFSCDDAVSNKHLKAVAGEYVKYIFEWNKCDGVNEKLNKPLMKQVMTLILLNYFILPITFNPVVSANGKLLQEAISKFDITIFDKESDISVRRIWGDAKDQLGGISELNKLSKKYQIRRDIDCIESLDDDECTKFLWIMGKCPLIVSESLLTIKAIEFCTNGKFVLLSTNSVTDLLEQHSIFRDINDLKTHPQLYQKLSNEFLCGTPGNESSLAELIRDAKSIETITTNELLKMIDGPYAIEHKQETLPIAYISRSLSRHVVDFKYLETVDKGTLIVISNVSNREKVLKSTNKSSLDGKNLRLFQNECSQEEFLQLCETNRKPKRRHHFKLIDEDFLEWLQSQGDISDIERFLLDGFFLKQECVADLQNSINVISDEPGKGKSVLLKSLKNRFRSKCWVVMFSSAHLVDLCAKIRKTEYTDVVDVFKDFLRRKEFSNFTNDFDKRVLDFVLRTGRIIYLWDALDEISDEDLDIVSNLIQSLSRKRCPHWITCRSHLKSYMQHRFCVFSRTISQFSEEEQRSYLEERLAPTFSDTNFDDVIAKIRSYLVFTTPDFFLGVPIQIYMLTELFISDPQKYANLINSQFLVTDLYSYSIEEKIKQSYRNNNPINPSHLEDCIRYRLPKYEIAALISLFGQEFITSLNLGYGDFFENIEKKEDKYGIITEVKGDDNKPQLFHSSYAEYFAATYFVKFYRKISTLKDILFDIKYTNIRFFFDMLLAQDSPAHIAVLHRNLELLKHCENLTCRDSGGRSALHLACSWGERYPVLKCSSEGGMYILEDRDTYLVKQESVDYMKMLERLLEKLDPLEKDNTFDMNSLCYAKKSESLLTIAFIEKKQEINCLVIEDQSIICSILYYSVMFGHDDVIDMFPSINVIKTKSDNSLLHLAVNCNQPKCLRKLLSMDKYRNRINDTNVEGFTALYLACKSGNEEMVKILLDFGASRSIIGKSFSLHVACTYGHVNIVELLISVKDSVGPPKNNGTLLASTSAVDSITTWEMLYRSDGIINDVNENGWTPLMVACKEGFDTIATLLINSGADVKISNVDGETALQRVCGRNLTHIVDLLIKSGCEIDARDKDGTTPLIETCCRGFYDVAEMLIKHGADINIVDKDGLTPLGAAFHNKHSNIVKLLIDHGADLNHMGVMYSIPLYAYCEHCYPTNVQSSIEMGADVNAAVYNGWRPIHIACYKGYEAIVRILLEAEADAEAQTSEGDSPIDIARENGHEQIVQLLKTFQKNKKAMT